MIADRAGRIRSPTALRLQVANRSSGGIAHHDMVENMTLFAPRKLPTGHAAAARAEQS
jgi:hypothetical protein